MSHKVVLMILDGWGIAKDASVSAVDLASTPFMDSLVGKYPQAQLEASGLAVGLPDGQMGNSEVGHTNLGAGRVVYQDLVKISLEAKSDALDSNPALQASFQHCLSTGCALHFMGLVSDGGVHSHIDHLKALLSAAHKAGLTKVYIHAFTDGRDTDPKSGMEVLSSVLSHAKQTTGQLASVCGRYFSMDRDNRWERVKKAYDMLVHGTGHRTMDPLAAVHEAYTHHTTDEFIEPIVVVDANQEPIATVQPHDAVVVFNFRTDRAREITQALTQQAFHEQNMHPIPLHYTTMTRYDASFVGIHVMYEKDDLQDTLGEVLEKAGKRQLRIAETEKYPHVTFFFSGGREACFQREDRILCPSPKVATYDLQPEMSARDLRDALIPVLQKGDVDFVCLNFANPDMVGHTGIMEAAIRAVETVDECAREVVKAGLQSDYTFLIIADHGNADCMRNADGTPNTSHTTQPVPFFVVGPDSAGHTVKNGALGDIAPTILHLMGLEKPASMTGHNLYS